MQAKQQMLKAIEELPDDANIVDALERLYLLYKIDRGIKQADAGELISQEESRQRMAKCLKYGGRRKLSTIWRRRPKPTPSCPPASSVRTCWELTLCRPLTG